MTKFSIANAFRRKGIAIVAICGTALGIALMTVLLSISDGMDAQIGKTMNELAGGIDVYPAGQMIPSNVGFPSSYIEEIEGIEHVETVSSEVLAFISTAYADFGDQAGVALRGLDLEKDTATDGATVHIIDGTTITGANEVIRGSELASGGRGMGPSAGIGDQFEVGDTMVVPTVGGEEVTLTVVGIFETGNIVTDGYIYSDMETARSLIPSVAADEVNHIHVEADSTNNVEAVAADIEAMFLDAEVPVNTVVSKEIVDTINTTMSTFTMFLWIISLVAAVAGGVSIFIVMLISVMERTKEFGILKASGWSNRNIINSVVIQSITVSLLGTVTGLLLGVLAGLGIDAIMPESVAAITWSLVVTIAAFGMIMGVVGGLYPALRAARVSPIESIRAI
jgi:putative ABC transport system permease protein